MSDLWNKCDVCGRFIALQDFADGKAKHILLEPDSELGKESWETLCAAHAGCTCPAFAAMGRSDGRTFCGLCGKERS